MADGRTTLKLKFFGVFDPLLDPTIAKLQNNQRLLLAYLVFNKFNPETDTRVRSPFAQRQPVLRETAAIHRQAYSTRTSEDPQASFDVALTGLRNCLGDRIRSGNKMVELVLFEDEPTDIVDVFEFIKAHHEKNYETLVSLYSGPLLEGVDSPLLLNHCGTRKLYEDWYKEALEEITAQAIKSADRTEVERVAELLLSAVTRLPNDQEVAEDYKRLKSWLSEKKEQASRSVTDLDEVSSPTDIIAAIPRIRVVPEAPHPYIAHTYTLLKVKNLIGRKREFGVLEDWVSSTDARPVLSVIAMGGVGKSALTWSWFSQKAVTGQPSELMGSIWWSFYHDEGSFESFLTRSVAYVCNLSLEQATVFSTNDLTNILFDALGKSRFLIVLDGLERLLVAYSRIDAAYVDQDTYDDASSEDSANRHAADFAIRTFLRRLTKLEISKVLITSRLPCADLQRPNGTPLPGASELLLTGLAPLDALELWHSFGSNGDDYLLLPFFEKIDHHPLLIQSLSSAVGQYEPAAGDFYQWIFDHPNFNILELDRRQIKTDVLRYAIADVPQTARHVLKAISAFRMPVTYSTLDGVYKHSNVVVHSDRLQTAIKELIDRGLIGRDDVTKEYDLHPLIRATAWNWATSEEKNGLYTAICQFFDTPELRESVYYWPRIKSIEDLRPIIEIFNATIGLKNYDAAYEYYNEYLHTPIIFRLKAYRLQTQLLEQLFTGEIIPSALLSTPFLRQDAKTVFASSLLASGQPFRAKSLFESTNTSLIRIKSLIATGELYEAELAISKVCSELLNSDDDDMGLALFLAYLGHVMLLQGRDPSAYFVRNRELLNAHADEAYKDSSAYTICTFAAEWLIHTTRFENAIRAANEGKEWLQEHNSQHNIDGVTDDFDKNVSGDYAMADILIGKSMIEIGEFEQARDQLQAALRDARSGAPVDVELRALIACAELSLTSGELDKAREYLNDTWVALRRGPYPLIEADANWILANIQLIEGDKNGAVGSAYKAYLAAWCNGPSHSYTLRLRSVIPFLRKLGHQIPTNLSQFDLETKPAIPQVELTFVD